MKPKRPRITQITVARLYNLGNYEHIRFELSAEVPFGASAKKTLFELASILHGAKPIKKPYNYDAMAAVLSKPEQALSEYEKGHLEEWREEVRGFTLRKKLQQDALEKMDSLGGTSKRTDAKEDWDSLDVPY